MNSISLLMFVLNVYITQCIENTGNLRIMRLIDSVLFETKDSYNFLIFHVWFIALY